MPVREEHEIYQYLRHKKKFPGVWCAGCGIGIVLAAIIRAVDRMGLDKNDVAMVSGIGCSGRMSVYVDFNTMHTTHGRALAFATGLKMARPDMHVLVVMGDGDALAIGGNHFIHAARRNIDITTIIYNNNIYGMTGGQVSPTTPTGKKATTAPYGNPDAPFDIARLAAAAGASYVARSTIYHTARLDKFIEQALTKRGFSVVEVLSPCPTAYGRMNKAGGPVEMLLFQKDHTVSLEKAAKMTPEELTDKIIVGVLVDREQADYQTNYQQIINFAQPQKA